MRFDWKMAIRALTGAMASLCLIASARAQPTQELQPDNAPAEAREFTREQAQEIVRDARRIEPSRGIEELRSVEIGGIQQWISIRGRDRRNPILLFVHGGPAFPEMPASWFYQTPLEDFFTVVQWDQRGGGKTAGANDAAAVGPTINVERMIADGEELVSYLRRTYGKDKIFLLGHSWGSIIGLEIAQRHPDWLHAYIGMGQVINMQENERVGYEFALREARAHQNAQAIADLEAIAPYPAADGSISAQHILMQRRWLSIYGGMTWGRTDLSYELGLRQLSPDYNDEDLAAGSEGPTAMRLLSELTRLDFGNVRDLDCPVFIFAGRHDYATPSELARAWYDRLRAPQKRFFWFENSAHMMQFEEPGIFLMHLVRDARPIAVRAGDGERDRLQIDE